ncbi:hypothetical protein [uncultured Paracoccus sp.]|uniref:hypothetical protein n=1 Tax=uncultured Paracoccus sp. TaxID=189685 RepID=UPI0025E53C8C|nr:hypothetical protein [uncultured Paracoccus sp.]
MLQLKIAAQPEWLDPAHGVRVKMLPPSTPVIVEARRISAGLMLAHGVEIDEDGVGHMGQALFIMTAAYVAAGALEWEGVADENGASIQTLTPDQVVALLGQEPEIFDFFDRGYASEVYALMSEKKGSSPSPSGSSEREAAPTAETPVAVNTAAEKASPAPSTSTR